MTARNQGLREPLHAMTEFTEDVHGPPKRSGEVTAPDGLDLGIRPGEEPAPPVERRREEHRGGDPPGASQPRRGNGLGARRGPVSADRRRRSGSKSAGRMNRHPPN
ncbi:hypothetical protein [Streptomyces sp. NBC_01320]|uniref:hypothetical protein n=1 Tax=Streptomyces sp. NBC_01320 TaxID=2903824 RepID=UPI002E125FCF|nr:hypothetical protein OG395_40870 [Streptomyces sp. NBC_01320]